MNGIFIKKVLDIMFISVYISLQIKEEEARMKRIFFIFGSAFLLLFAPSLIHADELFLGPEAFVPTNSGILYEIGSIETGMTATTGSPDGLFSAQIILPQGAKITGYTVFYKDNSASSFWFRMIRVVQYSGGWNSIFPSWNSAELSTDRQIVKKSDVNWAYAEIKNEACTYHFYVRFVSVEEGQDLVFYGAKIFYKMPV